MQNSVITASGALLAALIGLSGALWATISNQRKQQQAQRDNWKYDRRKDAYLTFIDAARAFTPLTEELFRSEERDYVAYRTSGTDPETETLEETITWAETFWTPFAAELSAKWHKKAPMCLQALTTAFDRIDLEGPTEVIAPGLAIVASAHRLTAGPELFAKEAEQDVAAGGRATESDLLRAEIHHYRMLCAKFRKEALEALK